MSPEDPLTAAAQRLRDLTGHQGQRDVPWTASWRETTRTYVVYSRTGRVVASTASEADAQYLAALASPDRVLLLADLFASINAHRPMIPTQTLAAAVALASAILHTDQPEG